MHGERAAEGCRDSDVCLQGSTPEAERIEQTLALRCIVLSMLPLMPFVFRRGCPSARLLGLQRLLLVWGRQQQLLVSRLWRTQRLRLAPDIVPLLASPCSELIGLVTDL